MDEYYRLATRILIAYESKLPFDTQATLAERLDAMTQAVEALRLKETGTANLKDIVRGAVVTSADA